MGYGEKVVVTVYKGPFGGEEYMSCMTRTMLLFFVLYWLLIWLYFVRCHGLRSGLDGTEKSIARQRGEARSLRKVIGLICYQNRADKPGHPRITTPASKKESAR